MDRYVLDCSVAVKWFAPEDGSDLALPLLQRILNGTIAFTAPDTFIAEFGHAIRSQVLRGVFSPDTACEAVEEMSALPIEYARTRLLASSSMRLALENTATFYDALYVDLARREDLQVLTADARMANAFASLGRCIRLADLG